MRPAAPFLSIVVPAYNESSQLAETVDDLLVGLTTGELGGRIPSFEILIAENGSVDGTRDLAVSLANEHGHVVARSLPRADYGAALRAGILETTGTVIACFDADYYDLSFLDAALGALDEVDMVLASKRATGSIDTRPWSRRVVTAAFAALLHVGFALDVSDTHGMKVMRREAVADLVPRCRFTADLFDTELVIRTVRAGRRVIELPVVVVERRPPRTSVWARMPRALAGLVRLRVALARESR